MAQAFGAKPHKLDFAGRLKLRDEERRELGDVLIVACGFDRRLQVFTPATWDRHVAEFDQLPRHDAKAQALYDLLVSSGEQCEVDAQSRVRIPDSLLSWADLGGGNLQAYLLRGRGCWQIWEEKNYHRFRERSEQLQSALAEFLGGLKPEEGSAAA